MILFGLRIERYKMPVPRDGHLRKEYMTESIKHQHLAELIEEEMAERGWTITDLVMNMGPHFSQEEWEICQLSWDLFIAVREPYVILGNEMAEQLSTAFGVSAKFFTSFHENWRKSTGQMTLPMEGED
jgi:plasmid maintenance system antidote protein VapI